MKYGCRLLLDVRIGMIEERGHYKTNVACGSIRGSRVADR
jgi:hypothetical protein